MPGENDFQGEIRVASRIVDYLSSGLYESPAACLKELINNSYDADAKRVDVFVKPDADRIIIEDDGQGMNREEFIKHFSLISESHKRDETDVTPMGRPKIGKIGIGFIAANEICDTMEIISAKKGSRELLRVTIRFDLMRQDTAERMRGDTSIAKADFVGTVDKTDADSQFTQVFLKQVRGEARSILAGATKSKFASGERSLYGLKPDSELKILRGLRSWSEFDSYSKTKLQVGLNVPVRYHTDWIPSKLKPKVSDISKQVSRLDFSLYFDGSEVRKPTVFHSPGQAFIDSFEFKGEHVSAQGYFYAQHTAVRPQELQGLLIRIRNAAVGEYDPSFLGFSSNLGPLLQSWISGEIIADDRLEDAMNIDRRTLRIAHPAYVELQKAVHEYLASLLGRVRVKIYDTGRKYRRKDTARRIEEKTLEIASHAIAPVSSSAAKEVRKSWMNASRNAEGQKKLLRKYTIYELYELVIDLTKGILSVNQLSRLVKRLTERLWR